MIDSIPPEWAAVLLPVLLVVLLVQTRHGRIAARRARRGQR